MKAIIPILALLLAATFPVHSEQFGLFTYEVTDGEVTFTDYPEDATGHVEIPDEIEGAPVTGIGSRAFGDCIGLSSVSIPDTVTTLGWFSFSGCTSLTSISIPDSITEIGFETFSGCTSLRSIAIPSGVTWIGHSAFLGCHSLEAIDVDSENPNYSSLDGVLFNQDRTTLLMYPRGKTGGYDVPDSVASIRFRQSCRNQPPLYCNDGAFEGSRNLKSVTLPNGITLIGPGTFRDCEALTSVTISASVDSIGDVYDLPGAFEDCTSLHSVIFLGDAPTSFDPISFANTAPHFAIYHLSTSEGFTSPTWNGYPTVMLDESSYPAAPWLVSHGLPQDTDLNHDLNNDGVSLLMAYALDLDPNENLSQHMLAPVLVDDSLTLTFHAAAPGVSYTVETSTDLKNWTTDGVTISDLDSNKQRTASVPLDAPRRFLRLVVAENP